MYVACMDGRKRPLTGFEPAPLSLQVKCAVRYTTEVVLTMRVRSRSRYTAPPERGRSETET